MAYDDFTEISDSFLFLGKFLPASLLTVLNANILEATLSPEVFPPVTRTHGQTVAIPTGSDGYVYSREEISYVWEWASTGPESGGSIRLPAFTAHIDQTTGLVSINVWRLNPGAPVSLTHDGSLSVTVIAARQRQHPELLAPISNPPDDPIPADTIHASIVLENQSAAISGGAVFTVPISRGGLYGIEFSARVTRAASSSSSLGGSTGFTVHYTDLDDSTAMTVVDPKTNSANNTSAAVSGGVVIKVLDNTNVSFDFGYTSSGTTVMLYELILSYHEIEPTGGPVIGGAEARWLGHNQGGQNF